MFLFIKLILNCVYGGWRDGSAFKRAYSFCREPLSSVPETMLDASQPSVTQAPRGLMPSAGLTGTYTHMPHSLTHRQTVQNKTLYSLCMIGHKGSGCALFPPSFLKDVFVRHSILGFENVRSNLQLSSRCCGFWWEICSLSNDHSSACITSSFCSRFESPAEKMPHRLSVGKSRHLLELAQSHLLQSFRVCCPCV